MEKSVDILKSFIISLAMLIQYEKIKDKARKYENGWTLANYIAPRIHPATVELSQKWIKPSSLNTLAPVWQLQHPNTDDDNQKCFWVQFYSVNT